jgi:hypothetical protein
MAWEFAQKGYISLESCFFAFLLQVVERTIFLKSKFLYVYFSYQSNYRFACEAYIDASTELKKVFCCCLRKNWRVFLLSERSSVFIIHQ